jgi:meiotic recombination protein SPO11
MFKQENFNMAVDYIAIMLRCNRDVLLVHANYRGVVVGHLKFRYDGCDIDCTNTDKLGHHILLLVNKVTNMTTTKALFILVVESISIIANHRAAKFEERFSCVIVSESGAPNMCIRKFVRQIKIVLRMPVLALADGDIGGFEILTVYNKGSKQMAYNRKSLITLNIYWLGVRPNDSRKYDIPKKCMKSLSDKELKYLSRLVEELHVREHDSWMTELNIMLETKISTYRRQM